MAVLDKVMYQPASSEASIAEVNKVVKNTYMLLSITLLFSAISAFITMQLNMPRIHWAIFMVVTMGITWIINRTQNSVAGLFWVFALTGFMGAYLGPILNMFLALANGAELIMLALASTAFIFLILSAYALTTKRCFNFLRGFVVAGGAVLFLAFLANRFFEIQALELAISAGALLWASATILWETSNIVNSGQRNYIIATVILYGAIYTLFIRLLHLLSFFMSGRQ